MGLNGFWAFAGKVLMSFKFRIEKIQLAYYRQVLRAPDLELYFPLFLQPLNRIKLGRRVGINAFVHIWAHGGVEIGDDTIIATHVQIAGSTHDYHIRPYGSHRIDLPVIIGKNVWIGSGAIILPGIRIGDNAVIGAGSLVTKDVPAHCIVYGSPASVKKQLEPEF